jgi:hypothetical protein
MQRRAIWVTPRPELRHHPPEACRLDCVRSPHPARMTVQDTAGTRMETKAAHRHERALGRYAAQVGCGLQLFHSGKEGTRTPKRYECPGQRPGHSPVETLTAYSHTVQAADLRLCHTMALTSSVRAARPHTKRPWSLRERLDERELAELITGYRNGATAASLATTHSVSLRSIKRILRTAGIRRAPSTRESEKATPTTTNP